MLTTKQVMKEAAKLGLDVSSRQLIYYEKHSLIPESQRVEGAGRVRYYEPEVVSYLYALHLVQSFGLSQKDNRELVKAWAKDLRQRPLKKLTAQVVEDFRAQHIKAMTMLFRKN